MTMQVRRLIYVAAILPCAAEVPTDYRSHCADATGSFVGLVGDFYWDATADEAGESWELIHASGLLDDKEQPSPANSYLGVYLQVEPDDGDSQDRGPADQRSRCSRGGMRACARQRAGGRHSKARGPQN